MEFKMKLKTGKDMRKDSKSYYSKGHGKMGPLTDDLKAKTKKNTVAYGYSKM